LELKTDISSKNFSLKVPLNGEIHEKYVERYNMPTHRSLTPNILLNLAIVERQQQQEQQQEPQQEQHQQPTQTPQATPQSTPIIPTPPLSTPIITTQASAVSGSNSEY